MSGMRRKAVIKPSQGLKKHRTPASVFTALTGKYHHHACNDCGLIYGDNCKDPRTNGRCQDCKGMWRPIWDKARDPRPCCVDNTELITDPDELVRYDLAGPGPWFQCRTCARCHPRPSVSPNLRGTP